MSISLCLEVHHFIENTEQATLQFISCPLVKMEDTQRLRLQYVAAMAHQEVFQQQRITNQLIKGRGGEDEPE